MLIPFPFAFLVGAAFSDAAGWWLENPYLSMTARHLTIGGIAMGLAAAIPGAIDYFGSVPPESSGKQRATKHALANVTALVLFALSYVLRPHAGTTGAILSVEFAGLVLLGIAGYMGGTLVYRNQIGVDHRYANAGKWREVSVDSGNKAVAVGQRDELEPNQMKLVHLKGARVALARTEEGFAAFDDRCTHKGGPLSDGVLMCGTVQCPWHGSQFDVKSGAVKCGPAKKKIGTHRIEESNNQVLLRS